MRALAAEQRSATVMVTTTDEDVPTGPLELVMEDHVALTIRPHDWQHVREGEISVWLAKCGLGGLTPATTHLVTARAGGEDLADATVTTRPTEATDVTVVFGSCFDIDATAADQTGDAYNLAVMPSRRDDVPVYNVWCGDQVYVDAPWQEGWRMSDARSVILDTYVDTWGHGRRASGFAYAMSQASNWYLPDDHEFWNGYPHPSFVTLPWHTVKRLAKQLVRFWTPQHDQPHPSAQGEWGSAAGEMYCRFQSDRVFSDFTDLVNPDQLQEVDLGSALLLLVDTRWRRTIRKAAPGARFMTEDRLERLEEVLATEERLICLSLSRPIIGRLPQSGPLRGRVEFAPEDYPRQYVRIWQALQRRAEAGRPTLVLGGDVHHHSIRGAFDDRMLEVVSSPLALLESLTEGSMAVRAAKAWLAVKKTARRAWDVVTFRPARKATTLAHPVFDDLDRPRWRVAEGTTHFDADEFQSGVTAVRISPAEPAEPGQPADGALSVSVRSVRTSGGLEQPESTEEFDFRWNGATWVAQL